MAAVSRKIKIAASQQTVFNVITDYESYPKFLSTLKGAEIVEKNGKRSVVEFQAQVVKPFRYTLELTEKKPSELTWKMVEGDFMRKNTGRWKLKDQGGKETEATYEIDVELSRLVPGFITKLLVEESLPQTLSEFAKRAEALQTKTKKKAP